MIDHSFFAPETISPGFYLVVLADRPVYDSLKSFGWRESDDPVGDALECSRAARFQTLNSLRSINSGVIGVTCTQRRISECLARIASTDKLIVMLGRELICHPSAADTQPRPSAWVSPPGVKGAAKPHPRDNFSIAMMPELECSRPFPDDPAQMRA